MKKRGKAFIALSTAMILIGFVAYLIVEHNLKSLIEVEIDQLNLIEIEDGKYLGEYTAFPVSVNIEVSVEDHRINSIRIIKHSNGQGGEAEAIIDEIIRLQSLDVDVISGATYSSQVIKLAIADAFK